MKIGSHVGMSGKKMLLGSVEEALSYKSNCFMIYTGAPQNTRRKKIDEMMIEEAHQLMKENNMNIKDCIVHAPYIVNLANKDAEKRQFAVEFLAEEVRRTHAIGIEKIVLHPGAHVGQGPELAIEYITEGLNKVFEKTKDLNVSVALETMAGKGTEIGRNFDEIATLINKSKYPERLSVCFDTCHTHDYGYEIRDNFDKVLEEFDKKIGLEKISCIHINDSKNEVGAKKDRHDNLGKGHIGFEALHYVVNHPKLLNIPKFLETPYITETEESTKRLYPPYLYEIEMLRTKKLDLSYIDVLRLNKK